MNTATAADVTAVVLTRAQVDALLLVVVSALKMDPELRTPDAMAGLSELTAAAKSGR